MTWPNKTLCFIAALFCIAFARPALAQSEVEMQVSTIPSNTIPTFLSIASGNAAASCRSFGGYAQGYVLENGNSTKYTATCVDTTPQFSSEQYVYVYDWVLPDPLAATAYGTCYYADGPWDASELQVYATTRCLINP